MIIFPILLVLFSWLLILWLCNQYKYLNIFEQMVLWFISALALFVLELFLQWLILNHLSLLFPIVTFVGLLWLFIYRSSKQSWYVKEIIASIKTNFLDIWKQFSSLKLRKKYLVLGIVVYVFVKVVMLFSINTNMPTFDEDAVAGRDIKTKIFASTQSLVLDKASPEYFGTDYWRYPFGGITDTYFLLPYGEFVNWLSNIISPLIYILSILLLFGIFLRKSNLFWAVLISYVFTSLPFIFIHGFGSYRNFPAWVLLFVFIFYLIDQLFHLDKEYWGNTNILLPLLFVGFLSSVIRNEGVMITGISFIAIIVAYHIFKKWKFKEIKFQILPLIPIILWYIINKFVLWLYPEWAILATWWSTNLSTNLINSFFTNLNQSGVFLAPFQQMFYHPDYILLFLLFFLALIFFVMKYKQFKDSWLILLISLFLVIIFMFTLYSTLSLGLVTHFAFIRYPVSIVLFLIYIVVYFLFRINTIVFHKDTIGKNI